MLRCAVEFGHDVRLRMILLIQVWLLLLVVLSGAKKHQERRVELDPLVAPSSPTSMIKTEKKRMEEVPCAEAKQNCALRRGCGNALHNFALGCAALRAGKTEHCSDHCQKSLIALTSTYEGQVLMKVSPSVLGLRAGDWGRKEQCTALALPLQQVVYCLLASKTWRVPSPLCPGEEYLGRMN